jgi:chromosome partitioning protein
MRLKNQYKMMDAFGRIFLGWVPWLGDRERRRPNVSARIISVANNKGGTAKTTTAVNLASGLAFLKGYRVLLVDSDPQGNASIALDVDIENLDCSLQDLLTGKVTDFKYLLWDRGDNLKILPASNALQDIENELVSNIDGRVRLRERLNPILNDFDYIIIDTPPTLSIFTQGPLIASTDVIVCVDVGFFSLQGIRHLLEDIEKIRTHYNPNLQIGGILLTKFDSRTILSKQVEQTLRKSFGNKAFKSVIRVNVDLIRSQIARQSIFAFDPNSTGAKDYQSLIAELVGNVVAFPQKRRVTSGATQAQA